MKKTRFLLCLALLCSLMTFGGAALAHDTYMPPVETLNDGPRPGLSVEVLPDPVSGWNARVVVEDFTINPAHVGMRHIPGEGHATLYVNGQRLTRVYGEWVHLGQLPAGRNVVTVTLNANNLANLTYAGNLIAADAAITVEGDAPAEAQMLHSHAMAMNLGEGGMDMESIAAAVEVSADAPVPAVAMTVTPDTVSGWNLHFDLENFAFAPEAAGDTHIEGQGHIHLYVNGKKIARVYDDWYHLPGYDGEGHEIVAVLTANTHAPLAHQGFFIRDMHTTALNNQASFTAMNVALLGQVPIPDLTLGTQATFVLPQVDNAQGFSARDGKGTVSAVDGGGMVVEGNDVWGWTDPMTGAEIALMGLTSGVSFVDVTDPMNPVVLGFLPSETFTTIWRDVKVYADHAFVVADASGDHGVQIFDLTRLRDVTTPQTFSADTVYTGVGSVHNIAINEDTGYAYLAGGNLYRGSLHIVDISDPMNPTYVTNLEAFYNDDTYTHDAQIVVYNGPDTDYQGQEIAFGSDEDFISISDVTDKTNIQLLSRGYYQERAYTHQGWLTEDHAYFISNDELDEISGGDLTNTYIWDVRDLDNPVLLNTYTHQGFNIDHNLYVHNGLVYQANYTAGLRVLDASDIANGVLEEVAYYDTYPANDNTSFNGAWSVYPYFESGTILVSDINTGLYLLRLQEDVSYALAPIELERAGALDAPPVLPTFSWRHQEDALQTEAPGDWYRLLLERDGQPYLDQWLPRADVCTGVQCTFDSSAYLPAWGLENGSYGWWVQAYYEDSGLLRLSNRAPLFTVDLPAAEVSNINGIPNEGRPTVTWADDPNTLWAQVWIGPNPTFGDYFTWAGNAESDTAGLPAYTCDGTTCTLDVAWDFPAGSYDVWMQTWGPGGASAWTQGPALTIPATAPGVPTTLGVLDAAADNPAFTWTTGVASTWFELVLEPDANTPDWTWSVGWFPASDLGCAAAVSTCTYTSPALAGGTLPDGDYVMRVRAWGPGGLSDYAAASFTYTGGA